PWIGISVGFIHQGFGPLVLLPLLYRYIGTMGKYRNYLLHTLLVVCYIFSSYGIELIQEGSQLVGENYVKHANSYVSDQRLERLSKLDEVRGVIAIRGFLFTACFYLLIIII